MVPHLLDWRARVRNWTAKEILLSYELESYPDTELTAIFTSFKTEFRYNIDINLHEYWAMCAVTNLMLERSLCLSTNRQYKPVFKNVQEYITLFVKLVSVGAKFHDECMLNCISNQWIIHCLLYYRIGDAHMAMLKHDQVDYSTEGFAYAKHFLYAINAYMCALDCLIDRKLHERTFKRDLHSLNPKEVLMAAELLRLIDNGFSLPGVEAEVNILRKDERLPFFMLYLEECEYIHLYRRIFAIQKSGRSVSKLDNFVVVDVWQQCQMEKEEWQKMPAWIRPNYIIEACYGSVVNLFIGNQHLLRRMSWLLRHDENSHLRKAFMNDVFKSITKHSYDDREVFNLQSLTRSDIRNFFSMLARNCSLSWHCNTTTTIGLNIPQADISDAKFVDVTFPYILHRDVRDSDKIIWMSICRLVDGEHERLNHIQREIVLDFFKKVRLEMGKNSEKRVSFNQTMRSDAITGEPIPTMSDEPKTFRVHAPGNRKYRFSEDPGKFDRLSGPPPPRPPRIKPVEYINEETGEAALAHNSPIAQAIKTFQLDQIILHAKIMMSQTRQARKAKQALELAGSATASIPTAQSTITESATQSVEPYDEILFLAEQESGSDEDISQYEASMQNSSSSSDESRERYLPRIIEEGDDFEYEEEIEQQSSSELLEQVQEEYGKSSSQKIVEDIGNVQEVSIETPEEREEQESEGMKVPRREVVRESVHRENKKNPKKLRKRIKRKKHGGKPMISSVDLPSQCDEENSQLSSSSSINVPSLVAGSSFRAQEEVSTLHRNLPISADLPTSTAQEANNETADSSAVISEIIAIYCSDIKALAEEFAWIV